ncbi:glycoside hydrolase family 2 protein [Sediminicola luteus]|uniref:Glycoside hydrolase family 2 n=1 Tax=Sediminicola luteus TaxID=319238 RepID=A0A2A4G8K1_9FLAO|nr:glycoside hydrolase family 2 TIM barrel-domain containing protein [Sediminicola luteus]PCE64741.1 glycoside hydrolase family 2 [Sediminicola luteus]
MKNRIFVLLLFLSGLQLTAQSRQLTQMEFHKGGIGGIWEVWRQNFQLQWDSVALPHTYNAEDTVDPDVVYYQGPAWYRDFLDVDNPHPNGRTVLHFEGSGHKTAVYVYDIKVDEHIGGYNEFWVDITEAVSQLRTERPDVLKRYKGKIPLAIRTDNGRDLEMIPSDMSDFNLYGGLYRKLHIKYLPETSLRRPKLTPSLSANLKKGQLRIELPVYDPLGKGVSEVARYRLVDPKGKTVVEGEVRLNDKEFVFAEANINKPMLWSPDTPYLYTLKVSWQGQERTEKIGFRTFEFKKKGSFYLNGKRLLIRGTHRHEEQAGIGFVDPDSLIEKEFKLMKDMGVNFVRLGHYQQSEKVLQVCDSLGIMVWEEIPWCRGGLGGETYKHQARQMLSDMIEQHYNHTSVIIWGLGNENDWKGDFETFEQEAIRGFMSELNDLSHHLDPSRKTGIRRCKFCADIVDVYSPSIWAGWYGGKFTEYKEVSKREMEKVDHFFHMEWGGSSHMYRHSEDPDKGLEAVAATGDAAEKDGDFLMKGGKARVSKDSDWTTSYIINLFDWTLKEQETMPWLTGAATWIFKDYSTAVRPRNPLPYVNQKGVVERDMTKKESYYVFQSYWTEKPMLHIYGSTWPIRWGSADEEKLLKVYSNCKTVELFLNGKSLGKRKRDSQNFPAAGLRWKTLLKPGKNTLKAIGYAKGQTLTDEISFEYETRQWGSPSKVVLKEVKRQGDKVLVEAQVFDTHGVPCLDAKEYLRFNSIGGAILIDNQGTSEGSRYLQLYNGRARIWVRLAKKNGIVSAQTGTLETTFLTLEP